LLRPARPGFDGASGGGGADAEQAFQECAAPGTLGKGSCEPVEGTIVHWGPSNAGSSHESSTRRWGRALARTSCKD
jgi:hypothetical protein